MNADPRHRELSDMAVLRNPRWIVADAGLLDPGIGRVVGLDKFDVDLWVAHSQEEAERAKPIGQPVAMSRNRGLDFGVAVRTITDMTDKEPDRHDILFLVRRVRFVGTFTAGGGTTCGEWTHVVDRKRQKGFFKASAASGWCPVRCQFCYLLGVSFANQTLALNVGEYAEQVAREFYIGNRRQRIPVINLGETGGLLEWCSVYGVPELAQAYVDATLDAGVVPYLLTKQALPGLQLAGAHVGISLNPNALLAVVSPGASPAEDLLAFLANAKKWGASTVIRLGPIQYAGWLHWSYQELAQQIHDLGLAARITVDLLRYSGNHPSARTGQESTLLEFRAHKMQEPAEVQEAHLRKVRELFPDSAITGCKLDPSVALRWVRQGLIQAMPCACWVKNFRGL